jgi:hypothetical protein
VEIGKVKLNSGTRRENCVDSTFHCRAVLKNEDGKETESFTSSIPSTFKTRETASKDESS